MTRAWSLLLFTGLATLACGPDRKNDCNGQHPDFHVWLELKSGRLSDDTVVHVTYGGSGMEQYSPIEQGIVHEVVFCTPERSDGGAAFLDASASAGASNSDESGIDKIECQLWTGGYAKLEVRTDGLAPVTYELTPRDRTCTVTQTFVLDSPDAG